MIAASVFAAQFAQQSGARPKKVKHRYRTEENAESESQRRHREEREARQASERQRKEEERKRLGAMGLTTLA